MMGITFRIATTSDLTSVQELAVGSFRAAYASFNTEQNMSHYLSENFSDEKLLNEIEAGEIFVGVLDGKIAAYAKLVRPDVQKVPGYKPLEIARLYTDAKQIGRGIGAEMINAIYCEAYARGCDSVCLDVWQKNYRAINFYQREGFRICGITQFRLGDDVQDDFVMLHKQKTI